MADDAKMSEIFKEMSERLLRDPETPSSGAAHVALLLTNVAWNQSVGLPSGVKGYREVMATIEADEPELWDEFKSTDVDAMIRNLSEYKKTHHPDDKRRVLTCGIPDGRVRVEWLRPAAPGVDSEWEMELYGLVRTSDYKEAVRFLRKTRGMPRDAAQVKIVQLAVQLGVAS